MHANGTINMHMDSEEFLRYVEEDIDCTTFQCSQNLCNVVCNMCGFQKFRSNDGEFIFCTVTSETRHTEVGHKMASYTCQAKTYQVWDYSVPITAVEFASSIASQVAENTADSHLQEEAANLSAHFGNRRSFERSWEAYNRKHGISSCIES
eukprot:TRINITY_DN19757_c0_g1_i2.p1 TRINITY_DN19757_c0_g1~~TRINITY_DN19757_c0_g1_i2.p1  ORF type:complete len:151 (+),score=10.10 TRINITY_DN19757_c0_g1_i2:172-624(+)